MTEKQNDNQTLKSWFGKWFLNNKTSIVLLNVLLVFVILFVFNKISYLFDPINAFIGAVMPAIVLAGVQYYLMNPLVDLLESKFNINRSITIVGLFIVVVALLIWALVSVIPILQDQIQSIIDNWPAYWSSAEKQINGWLRHPEMSGLKSSLSNFTDSIQSTFLKSANTAISETIIHLSTAFNVIAVVFMTVLTAPFILFYMLKDGRQLKGQTAKFFPVKYRKHVTSLLTDINQSVASYVRGQLTVAFWVGVMFAIGYSVVGQSYALTLAIVAAVLNLVPYFGTFIALIPALMIAMFDSTGMLVKVIIIFMIEQTVESKLISPLVLGSKMEMHPVTTILVLIGGSAVSGLWGVIFAIPVYAIVKIVLQRIFDYYRKTSGLYEEDFAEAAPVESEKIDENMSNTIQKH